MKCGFELWNNSELYTMCLLKWNTQNNPVSENSAFTAEEYPWSRRTTMDKYGKLYFFQGSAK